MKKLVILIAFICYTVTSVGQIHEVGIFAGGSNYIGDIGPEYYINPNEFMGGLIYKRNLNPRIAVRGTFTMATISSDDLNATNQQRLDRGINFKNNIKELALGIEYNYFEYNIDDRRLTRTPYILVELAAFNYNTITEENDDGYVYENNVSYAIPFGLGYKSQLAGDWAIALEVRARYTFEDDIDYNNSSIESLQFGNPNSNDWYMFSGISIVYSFGRPPCYATPF